FDGGLDTLFATSVDLSDSSQVVSPSLLTLTLSSGSGLENVLGSVAGDTLLGNDRDNLLDPGIYGPSEESLAGGAGNDIYAIYRYPGALRQIVVADSSGNDTLNFSNSSLGISVDLSETSSSAFQEIIDGNLELRIDSGAEIENVIGSIFDDTITSGATGSGALDGGSGNDTLADGGADTTFVFGAGDLGSDTIDAGDGGANTIDLSGLSGGATLSLSLTTQQTVSADQLELTLSASSGVENIIGTAYDDVLSGDSQANSLLGGAGDDQLNGGGGDDTVAGGSGDDTYLFTGTLGGSVVLTESSAQGSDTLDFSGASNTQGITVDLGSTSAQTGAVTGTSSVTLQLTSNAG